MRQNEDRAANAVNLLKFAANRAETYVPEDKRFVGPLALSASAHIQGKHRSADLALLLVVVSVDSGRGLIPLEFTRLSEQRNPEGRGSAAFGALACGFA